MTGLGLEYFSETDRFQAIVNFLEIPEMFEKVSNNISIFQYYWLLYKYIENTLIFLKYSDLC